MNLVLVRHSEVLEEYQGKYNGHIDIPLSKKGLEDAKELGEQLQSYDFDAIYCSDLTRTKETLAQFNLPIKPLYSKELREKSWGKHEGMSFEEIEASGIKYTTFSEWIEQLDGESVTEFTDRIENFFLSYLKKQKDLKTVLIVTHSGVIKTLLQILNNQTLEESFSKPIRYSSVTETLL
ncbi:histidine phosphatase family protein [Sulfurimonas marina]|uniref:Histidine phosphatase family protein n=1 Tax=Sulfurimonas marina TaxID=2590551 RepID=A0A7M3V934_9BACT|nr:histidine phosphatase family protein [Sulfurimonas marina]QOP40267.1 histidine phosphatase family protein [Sulfurimonas marina]